MIRYAHLLALACLVAPACKSSDAGKVAAARSFAWTPLPQFKLQALVPPSANVTDTSRGRVAQLSIDADTAAFDVRPISNDIKLTLEQAITDALADPSVKRTVTVKELLPDGFHLEVTSASGLIAIRVQRTIGGVDYWCDAMTPGEGDAKVIRDACLSLKPL